MITPGMIVDHLGTYLPRATDLFNDTIEAVTAEVGAGNVLTITTAVSHGLSVGRPITVSSAVVDVPITNVIEDGDFVYFETSSDHDLTEPRQPNDLTDVTLAGFTNSEWNGVFKIVRVPNRLHFSVKKPSGASLPALNGDEFLSVERSVSIWGIRKIATVPDATSFTVDLGTDVPDMSGLSLSNVKIATSVRIYAAADIKRAEKMYTKINDNKLKAFVVMTDLDVSKDRRSISDATATFSNQDAMRLRLLQNFAVLVFCPTENSVSGATAQELIYGEVYQALLRVLYGFSGFAVDSDGSTFVTVSTGHGQTEYRNAYYIQAFEWQVPVDITIDNGWGFVESVAFRNIGGSLAMNNVENEEKFGLSVDLDDEPL